MRVTILSVGSRGDVQPYVALARALIDAGHSACLATHSRFEWLARAYGVPLRPLGAEPFKAFLGLARPSVIRSPARRWRSVRGVLVDALDEWLAAASGADLLVAHPKIFLAPEIGAHLNIPIAYANTLPVACPTRAFPCCYLFGRSLGSRFNLASYRVLPALLAPLRSVGNAWCTTRLGTRGRPGRADLWGRDGVPVPHLHGHSSHVLPAPDDWADAWINTGYWHLDPPPEWSPSPPLARFLAEGAPPVYVGFGSMVYRGDRERLTRRLVGPLLELGERVVMVRGWALSSDGIASSGDVHLVDEYEGPWHSWLFPRTKAVIHHGGPGTFGAALLAGRPQLSAPFAMDQPFWGRLAHEHGVGPRPISIARASGRRWARHIRDLLSNPRYETRALELSRELAAEDGAAAAVSALERVHARGSTAGV